MQKQNKKMEPSIIFLNMETRFREIETCITLVTQFWLNASRLLKSKICVIYMRSWRRFTCQEIFALLLFLHPFSCVIFIYNNFFLTRNFFCQPKSLASFVSVCLCVCVRARTHIYKGYICI